MLLQVALFPKLERDDDRWVVCGGGIEDFKAQTMQSGPNSRRRKNTGGFRGKDGDREAELASVTFKPRFILF